MAKSLNENLPTPKPEGGALVVTDFGAEAGGGLENVRSDEYKIPFLTILQSNSPQLKRPADGGIAGAKAGMIFNTATGELYDGEKGIPFVPAQRDSNYVEYTPRESGGGFIGVRPMDDPQVLALRAKQGKFGKLVADGGNEIVETRYLAIVAEPEGLSAFPAIIPFKSTQIGKHQSFMTRTLAFKYKQSDGSTLTAALWMHKWVLETAAQKNKKGDFYGWRLRLSTLRPDGTEAPYQESMLDGKNPLRQAARDLNTMLKEGRAKADHEAMAQTREPGDDEEVPM